jgi:hypothetical protein
MGRTPLALEMDDNPLPNIYDWDGTEEHQREGDRLKRHRAAATRLLDDGNLQGTDDQAAIRREIANTEQQLRHWAASRRRRAEFQRRGLIPPD